MRGLGRCLLLALSALVCLPAWPAHTGERVAELSALEYQWSAWSAPSPCSRSCGLGVLSRRRSCYLVRDPPELVESRFCPGESRDFLTCNPQPCPEGSRDLRSLQCSFFDRHKFRGHHVTWVPFRSPPCPSRHAVGGLPVGECALVCRPKGSRGPLVKFSQRVVDGTRCGVWGIGLCVRGECTTVGCDGRINSEVTSDRCGVCGGDNSTCNVVTSSLRRRVSSGYTELLELPVQATHVRVVELPGSAVLLAMKSADGLHFLYDSGDRKSNNTRSHQVAGTAWLYRHGDRDGGLERLSAEGPLNHSVLLLGFTRQHGSLASLSYQFTLPSTGTGNSTRVTPQDGGREATPSYSWRSLLYSNVLEGRGLLRPSTTPLPPSPAHALSSASSPVARGKGESGSSSYATDGSRRQASGLREGRRHFHGSHTARKKGSQSSDETAEPDAVEKDTSVEEYDVQTADSSEDSSNNVDERSRQTDSKHDAQSRVDGKGTEKDNSRNGQSRESSHLDSDKPAARLSVHWSHEKADSNSLESTREWTNIPQPGIRQPHRTASESEPGVRQPPRTFSESEPGVRQSHRTVSESEPGVRKPLRTASESEPGVRQPHRTVSESESGVRQSHRTASESEPGVRKPLRTVSESESGVRQPHRTVSESESGVRQPHRTASESEPGVRQPNRTASESRSPYDSNPIRTHAHAHSQTSHQGSRYSQESPENSGVPSARSPSLTTVESGRESSGSRGQFEHSKSEKTHTSPSRTTDRGDEDHANDRENILNSETTKRRKPDDSKLSTSPKDDYEGQHSPQDSRSQNKQRPEKVDLFEGSRHRPSDLPSTSQHDVSDRLTSRRTMTSSVPRHEGEGGARPIRRKEAPRLVRKEGHRHRHHHHLRERGRGEKEELQVDLSVQVATRLQPERLEDGGQDQEGGDGEEAAPLLFEWRPNLIASCSSTCEAGVQVTFFSCFSVEGHPAPDERCDASKRPDPSHHRCARQPCKARWVAGVWGPCSSSCGPGETTRSLHCWRMLAPGFDSTVRDILCDVSSKPPAVRPCYSSCDPQWMTSEWTQCSVGCGQGYQMRLVECSTGKVTDCDHLGRPLDRKACNAGACTHQWQASSWSECNGLKCGMMTRHVTCHDVTGQEVEEELCDVSKKPLSVHACGLCTPAWIPQEWSKCQTYCGKGVSTRALVCGESHPYTGFHLVDDVTCLDQGRPLAASWCNALPCLPTWHSAPWSECTQTCGEGAVRTRQVQCFHGSQVSGHCSLAERPPTTEMCRLYPCQEWECRDDGKTDCVQVLQSSMCSHFDFQTACCKTCSQQDTPVT